MRDRAVKGGGVLVGFVADGGGKAFVVRDRELDGRDRAPPVIVEVRVGAQHEYDKIAKVALGSASLKSTDDVTGRPSES